MKKSWIFGALLCASLLLVSCGSTGGAGKSGTYSATSKGLYGPVSVSVELANGVIKDVKVTESRETPGVGGYAAEVIPARIVEAGTPNVDVITGVTVTSAAIKNAVTDCLNQAGIKPKAAKKAPKQSDIEASADVVIVGGGGAGLAAAVAATDKGATVILIEKTGFLGGNSIVAGGIYNAADPALQVPAGIQDSPEFHAQQTWEGGDKRADYELVKVLCYNALDGMHWLEKLGWEQDGTITQGVGALYRRTHSSVMPNGTGFIKAFKDTLDTRKGMTFMMDTTGKSLIVENGKVVGVNAVGKTGNKVTLRANKGVILATGGFAGNVAMRQEYCEGEKWPDLGPSLITSNMPAVTGDGIRMAKEIGAALYDIDQIQLLQVCNPWTGVTSDVVTGAVDACIYVNQEGKRFVREDGRRDVISAAILAQTGGRMYTIYNHIAIPDPKTHKCLGGRTFAEFEEEGEYGYVSANTLEELAKKLNMPYDNLKATIDAYNKHVDNHDATDEFGRQLLTTALKEGPWYAHPRAPAAHHTMGGIKIDTGTHVIAESGKQIPGLYAAGETTGGIHGGNRLGGNAIVDFTVFGRIAGTNAAEGK